MLHPQHVRKCIWLSSISLWAKSKGILLQGVTPLHLICFNPRSGDYDCREAEAIMAALLLSGANTSSKDSQVISP